MPPVTCPMCRTVILVPPTDANVAVPTESRIAELARQLEDARQMLEGIRAELRALEERL